MKTLALMIFISVAAFAQEHARTAEQCKADQAVWGSDYARIQYNEAETQHVQNGALNRTDIGLLTIRQVKQRMNEMYQCAEVVTSEPFHCAGNFYSGVIADRYYGFLIRHRSMTQLVEEDAAGKR